MGMMKYLFLALSIILSARWWIIYRDFFLNHDSYWWLKAFVAGYNFYLFLFFILWKLLWVHQSLAGWVKVSATVIIVAVTVFCILGSFGLEHYLLIVSKR